MVKKANRAELIRSIFIPAFSSKPITLIGIPYLIRLVDILSQALGLTLPVKKPNIIKGTIFINNLEIVLNF